MLQKLNDFFQQYSNLALIADQSTPCIGPDGSHKPSNFPHGRALARLLFSSLADTFERYLVDLLIEIHLAQPNTLKSESSLTADVILNCLDMSEVIKLFAEKKVGDLPKGNSKEFGKYIKKITNIDLYSAAEQPKADEIFELRNLYTHSNGIVDTKFLRMNKTDGLKAGDEHMISLDQLCETCLFFLNVVARIDSQAVSKYYLSK
jgi:hypothetical protein